ncbi:MULTISPECIES: hypothetical protein [unclassified Shinella]|uniref:hypothetical protein n=1 Tax=unclassified Shinella TaxID=2643062 RepID=UPI00225D6789|nr:MULTISPECIES: hypothetical protein [unclassified Shinella]MCO5140475.1 hypothetical protein [Shinella sp.]MDC7254802.1 hypothetical protein [Shinella sp. YE25]CAI0337542.1 conserved exported hypothetical protein [Rhizobiaceae bacterium]CAK7256028.1 conserved exported protein of unknown function [Shinella sp. WSC3-e]
MPSLKTVVAIAIAFALTGCTAASALEPIPGSIIYKGQPRTKLMKAPIGSTFEHRFRDRFGDEYMEVYRIAPDRSLELLSRRRIDIVEFGLGR